MDRTARLSPLGRQRLNLLDCLGGNSPGTPGYFDPGSDVDIFTAFRKYATRLSQEWASESDPNAISLLAAARFLSGDVDAGSVIVEHLPAEAVELDHGAGICLLLPLHSLSTALPLPAGMTEISLWLAGSATQQALLEWLAANRDQLVWVEAEGIYELS